MFAEVKVDRRMSVQIREGSKTLLVPSPRCLGVLFVLLVASLRCSADEVSITSAELRANRLYLDRVCFKSVDEGPLWVTSMTMIEGV